MVSKIIFQSPHFDAHEFILIEQLDIYMNSTKVKMFCNLKVCTILLFIFVYVLEKYLLAMETK